MEIKGKKLHIGKNAINSIILTQCTFWHGICSLSLFSPFFHFPSSPPSLPLPTCTFGNLSHIGQHRQCSNEGKTPFPTSHSLPASQVGLGQNDGEHTPGSILPDNQPQNPGVPRGASAYAIILGKLNRQPCTSDIPLLFHPRPPCDRRHIIPSPVDGGTTIFSQNVPSNIHPRARSFPLNCTS